MSSRYVSNNARDCVDDAFARMSRRERKRAFAARQTMHAQQCERIVAAIEKRDAVNEREFHDDLAIERESAQHVKRDARSQRARTRDYLKRADAIDMLTDKRERDAIERVESTHVSVCEIARKRIAALLTSTESRAAIEHARRRVFARTDDRSRYARFNMRALKTAARAETVSERDARMRRESDAASENARRARRSSERAR